MYLLIHAEIKVDLCQEMKPQLGSGSLAFSSSGVAVGFLLHLALMAHVTATRVPANTETAQK